jgi:hypothetical protein
MLVYFPVCNFFQAGWNTMVVARVTGLFQLPPDNISMWDMYDFRAGLSAVTDRPEGFLE